MLLDKVKKLHQFDRYLYWVGERELVRWNKEEHQPKPWTNDPILQNYRFCNVVRMEDKVSRWLLQNWYEPNTKVELILRLVACGLARFINKPSSLEVIGFPTKWEPEVWKEKLRKHRDEGNTIFNSAYMVRGNNGIDKIECVIDYYVKSLYELRNWYHPGSMKSTWENILESFGMGSFMAGQVVADFYWYHRGWKDAKVWSPMGPGSRRGMNRLRGREVKYPVRQSRFEKELAALIEQATPKLSSLLTNRMLGIDWQNTLCEFDKYERVLWGEGRPKSNYAGAYE